MAAIEVTGAVAGTWASEPWGGFAEVQDRAVLFGHPVPVPSGVTAIRPPARSSYRRGTREVKGITNRATFPFARPSQ